VSGSSTSNSISGLSIGTLAGDPGSAANAFYLVPRLALDAVVAPHVTLGGAAWVYTQVSGSSSSGSISVDRPKATYFGLAPRVGYIAPLSDTVAFWPRAGIEYHTISTSSTTSAVGGSTVTFNGGSEHQLAADLEAHLVVTPWDHIGFDVELYGAIPITGGSSTDASVSAAAATGVTSTSTPDEDISQLVVGLTAGMVAYW
jgi:hypothetical protein